MQVKSKLLLIAGFYHNEVPTGLGIKLDQHAIRMFTDVHHTLDSFAEIIESQVNTLMNSGYTKETGVRHIEQIIKYLKNNDPTIASVTVFLSLVQFLEQSKFLIPDNTNGMIYQKEVSWV